MRNLIFICLCMLMALGAIAQTRNFRVVKVPAENPSGQKRKAVVIGMSDYDKGRNLDNTLNDANDMAEVLTRLGFEVTLLKNNDLRTLLTNLTEWYNTIADNDMAVFYYAGHGIEVNGQNYLIPVGASLNSATDAQFNTLNVNQVLGNMDEKKVRMKLLILDACRDNPFSRSWTRSSSSPGLATMSAPKGTYIAFAALPGSTAQDGGNYNLPNGVFTYYLKQEIVKPGLTIDQVFNNVTNDVATLTNDLQTPFKNSSIRSDFYFLPKKNEVPPVVPEKKYYYYVDQRGNKGTQQFASSSEAEIYMKRNLLYGKIYSNMGEVFVVEETPNKPAVDYITVTQTDYGNRSTRNGHIYIREYIVRNSSHFKIQTNVRLPYGYYRDCNSDPENFVEDAYWGKVVILQPGGSVTIKFEEELKSINSPDRSKCSGISTVRYVSSYVR
ncbi:Caspase domain-containing protein [Chitinophaga jiangningensis]|uniref:Caspase domain-containing protein n=1 Tax=Chitinophaga jiangningensis TaxID=1419482 RepID=A0A1M7LAC9_9BACT|nr:caspase family protein [Chitinophaga jiangningensis]SHM75035.1 Caspase domain-containing protein [Chitinophaga jiangningensis]